MIFLAASSPSAIQNSLWQVPCYWKLQYRSGTNKTKHVCACLSTQLPVLRQLKPFNRCLSLSFLRAHSFIPSEYERRKYPPCPRVPISTISSRYVGRRMCTWPRKRSTGSCRSSSLEIPVSENRTSYRFFIVVCYLTDVSSYSNRTLAIPTMSCIKTLSTLSSMCPHRQCFRGLRGMNSTWSRSRLLV